MAHFQHVVILKQKTKPGVRCLTTTSVHSGMPRSYRLSLCCCRRRKSEWPDRETPPSPRGREDAPCNCLHLYSHATPSSPSAVQAGQPWGWCTSAGPFSQGAEDGSGPSVPPTTAAFIILQLRPGTSFGDVRKETNGRLQQKTPPRIQTSKSEHHLPTVSFLTGNDNTLKEKRTLFFGVGKVTLPG